MKLLTLLSITIVFLYKPIARIVSIGLNMIFKPIDELINSFTMYKIMMFSLSAITILATILSLLGLLPFSLLSMGLSLTLILSLCFLVNVLFAQIFSVYINLESSFISGMILFLIFSPASSGEGFVMLVVASLIAMASKYIFAIKNKHIFNPVAIAAVAVQLLGFEGASWWVATPLLAPVVAICGVLILRKIHKFSLFFTFFGATLFSLFLYNVGFITNYIYFIRQVILSWPILFLGGFMLTEPYTMPPTKELQIVFGLVIGIIFGSQLYFGPFYATPEMALVLGNIFAYLLSSKRRLMLTLKRVEKLSATNYEFAFSLPKNTAPFSFKAGQYLEWTLPLPNPFAQFKNKQQMETHASPLTPKTLVKSNLDIPDLRGNRRFFTIASSPTRQDELVLGIKIPPTGASFFKQKMLALKPGNTILAGQLAGDFTLPTDLFTAKKNQINLVFIAGGIGITPFRSLIEYLVDVSKNTPVSKNANLDTNIGKNKQNSRDISVSLLYFSSSADDFVYQDFFTLAATKINLRTHYIITKKEAVPQNWSGQVGRITPGMLERLVPRSVNQLYYLSGPNSMVNACKKTLLQSGIAPSKIKEDYFPGY